MKRRMAVLLVLGMLPWAGLNAQQTAFRVTARVVEFCDVAAPDRPLPAAAQLRATCTPKTSYLVGPNRGTSPGATINDTVTGVGTGLPVDHTLFGGVSAVQVAPPGDQADTVSVRFYY